MATGIEELMHQCIPKHLRMGAATIKYEEDTDEEDKRGVSMERSIAGKKKVPTAYHYLIKHNIYKHHSA